MTPSTRLVTVNSSNGDEGITREYLDSQLAEMWNLIATSGLQQNKAMNQRRQANQFGRLAKVEFPKFQGDDVKGWAFRCDQFFRIYNTPNEEKVKIMFGSIFEDPVSALKNAKYDKSVRDYQYLFDTLLFILEPIKKKSKPIGNANLSRFGNGGYYRNNNRPAVLPLPASSSGLRPKPNTLVNAPVRKQLTQKEYQEKRAQNLYFYYDQRYSPCHKCSRQLYSLVVLADKEEEYFEVEEGDDELIIPYKIP
ncbi:hypothetical protein Tco_0797834 [Tanacetum coccineum]